jgi:hypothetical protein
MESHFVKLEPPYQIIHYGGAVGIQIGTLITVGICILVLPRA